MITKGDFKQLEAYRDKNGGSPCRENIINLFLNYEDDIILGTKILDKLRKEKNEIERSNIDNTNRLGVIQRLLNEN